MNCVLSVRLGSFDARLVEVRVSVARYPLNPYQRLLNLYALSVYNTVFYAAINIYHDNLLKKHFLRVPSVSPYFRLFRDEREGAVAPSI